MGLYRKVSCAYWQGELAESLRGDSLAHAVAFYLMTCPSTNAIGCYRLSIATLCDDLGEPSERASGALRKLSGTGFVVVDERFRMVFVTEFARHEYGEVPNLADNRVKSLRATLPAMMDVCRKSFVWGAFWDRYGGPWAEVLAEIEPPKGRATGGLPEGFGSPSGRGPDQEQDQEQDQDQEERDPTGLVGDPDGSADDTPDNPSDPKKAAQNGHVQEMRWRIEETWAAHLGMREYYWQDVEFSEKPPGSPPTLTPQRRKLIGEALKRHDKGLLKAEDRERWKAESKTRAAGIGIFLDPWCTARSEGNVLAEGGKRYLEPERAWKIKSGVDQVERFAELYFARKERRRGTS